MNVNEPDVNDSAAAERTPRFRNPLLQNETINQDVQMGNAALVELKDCDVVDRAFELAKQRDAKLVEHAS